MTAKVRTLEHIADLRRQPGLQRPLRLVVPAHGLGPLATSSAAVPEDATIELDAVAEATGADVVVSGQVSFEWEGDCRRCLEPVAGSTTVPIREIFEPVAVEGETWPVEGDAIDLGPVLHDVVLLALPLVPLCSPDCTGPDPERFPTRVEGEGSREASDDDSGAGGGGGMGPVDPRWAALDELRFD